MSLFAYDVVGEGEGECEIFQRSLSPLREMFDRATVLYFLYAENLRDYFRQMSNILWNLRKTSRKFYARRILFNRRGKVSKEFNKASVLLLRL